MRMKKKKRKPILILSILVAVLAVVIASIWSFSVAHYKVTRAYKETTADLMLSSVIPQHEIQPMAFSEDSYSNTQWPLRNKGSYISYEYSSLREKTSTKDVDMEVIEAWDMMKQLKLEQKEIIIAIIDTGVDYMHPDLADHIWINKGEIPGDGIDNDNNGYIDDVYGWDFYNNDSTVSHYEYDEASDKYMADPEDNDNHGTHIAGIIGAVADNDIGIAGIASNLNIKLMILKINGGPKGTGNISNAVEAIKYATRMGAQICNISWGTSKYSESLKNVIEESDMLFVAAAGNTGSDNDVTPIYPASFGLDNLISVTYVDANGELTKRSNYGSKTVDIAAPGEDIFSTIIGGYISQSGSSMAAPQVSAIAAMLYASGDKIYASTVKDIIVNNVKPLTALSGRIIQPGIPNALEVLESFLLDQKTDTMAPTMNLTTVFNKNRFLIPIELDDVGGSGVRVVLWQSGKRVLEDFNRGTTGSVIRGNQVTLDKAGIYTFYASDYAGNETVIQYEVIDDTTAPSVNASYSKADANKTRTFTVRVADKESGVRRVKYMKGKKTMSDFLPAGAGTELQLINGKATFKIKDDGIYSIYAIDNRGNITVKWITVKKAIVLSRPIALTRQLRMNMLHL